MKKNLIFNTPIFIILFPLSISSTSCCHQTDREPSTRITKNSEIIDYKEEWEPALNEPFWKVSVYETLKNWSEEYNE